ncbi:MAG: phenylacetate-CoA oxygenase subunit PaaJ [Chloroflexota bacterium]|nr:phenylacetate-CoA oxygenase subunit PaaJ [Chloroflexota bacterium]
MIGFVDEAAVRAALAEVPDPEIPVVSVVDLGMIEAIDVTDGAIRVELLPTFVGCPAIDVIRDAVATRLGLFGRPVEVDVSFRVPWTSERITLAGRDKLRRSGFAPPTGMDTNASSVRCPYCGSDRVVLDNLFGPTQCRSLFYCRACRQPFEQFKAV